MRSANYIYFDDYLTADLPVLRSRQPLPPVTTVMAPRFIRSLVPKKAEKDSNEPTFWQAAKSVTLLQYAMFFSG
jgi:hypothetical protein